MKLISVFVLCLFVLGNSFEWVDTPVGKLPKQCVHHHEEHAIITPRKGGIHVHYPKSNRTFFQPELQECVEAAKKIAAERRKGPGKPLAWDIDASFDVPSMGTFTASYTLPSSSPPSNGQLLYFFTGFQNNDDSAVSIVQPVVAFQGSWYMNAWNCCPSGQANTGPTVSNLQPGGVVPNYIKGGQSQVEISMTYNGQTSSLTVAENGRTWDWACVTLEQYSVSGCSDYNKSPFQFNDMKLSSMSGSNVAPNWSIPGVNSCGGQVTGSGANLAIIGTNQ
jgi:hypothetical protein